MYRNTSVCKRLAEHSGSISVFGQSIFHGSAGQLNISTCSGPFANSESTREKKSATAGQVRKPLVQVIAL